MQSTLTVQPTEATPAMAPACRRWFDERVAWEYQNLRAERRHNPDAAGTQAEWLDTIGRERFSRFVDRFDIVKPVGIAAPLLSLRKGRRAMGANDWSPYTRESAKLLSPDDLPFTDHARMWKDASGALVFASFPYHPDRDDCERFALTHGLDVVVDEELDFYFRATTAVIWRLARG